MEHDSSKREFTENLRRDLGRKLVVLTGARQAGKTTLARQLMAGFELAQYLNWDVPADRQLIAQQAWSPKARLLVVRVHGVQPLPARHFQATSVAMTSSNRCKPLI